MISCLPYLLNKVTLILFHISTLQFQLGKIYIEIRTYESLENGTKIRTTTPVNLIPCTLDRF